MNVVLDYDISTIFFFVLYCYLLPFVVLIFLSVSYLFWSSNLLPLPLYSTNGSWRIPALHVMCLPFNSAGLRLFLFCCFVLGYPFINQVLHFLSFSFFPLCSLSVLLYLTLPLGEQSHTALYVGLLPHVGLHGW
jgi:hypothetical protein